MKKRLFLLMVLLCCLTLVAGVFAACNGDGTGGSDDGEGLEYRLSDDGESYIVSGIGICADAHLVIPHAYNDLPVTIIGDYAFYNCTGLTSVTVPDSVTSIGDYAFENCTNLTSVTIPDSVTSIGLSAFRGCSSLESITIPFVGATMGGTENTHFGYIFGASSYSFNDNYVPTSLKEIVITGGTSIGDYAFAYCYGLTSIIIPDSVTSIGDSAFHNCTGLTSIEVDANNTKYASVDGILYNKAKTSIIHVPKAIFGDIAIPNSVTSIDDDAFSYCYDLTSITIPDSVTSIGNYAFDGCTGLTSVTIGNGVTSIGERAFVDCTGLTTITVTAENPVFHSEGNCIIETASKTLIVGCKNSTIPDDGSVTIIGEDAFSGCSGLTSITIPDSVTSIGDYAFLNCSGLTYNEYDNAYYLGNENNPYLALIKAKDESITSCTIHEETKFIHSSAFEGCAGLASVTIGDSVTSIGDHAFRNCTGLTSITIPDSVTSIGGSAFYGCTGLASVTIPDSVTSIGAWAFEYCSGLTSITIGDGVTSIGNGTFEGCNGLTYNEYDNAYYLGNENNPYLALIKAKDESITSCTIHEETKFIHSSAFYGCDGLTSVTIPDSVTSIGDYAFSGCDGLTSITIPDSVTSIGSSAFNGCSGLTSVTIPDSVTSIGGSAFLGCDSLTSITIPDSVTSIGSSAFSGCTGLTSVTIPDSVTIIEDWTFEYCGLRSVTIPDSVTSIGSSAFNGCSGLTYVRYDGTVAEWNAIKKVFNWKSSCPFTKVVCSNGTVSV